MRKEKGRDDFSEEIEIEIGEGEPVFTSGVVCRLLEIPVWILKQLDREKIVCPPRTEGKARLYCKNDLKKIKRVWYYMRQRHVNIGGIMVILEMEEGIIEEE